MAIASSGHIATGGTGCFLPKPPGTGITYVSYFEARHAPTLFAALPHESGYVTDVDGFVAHHMRVARIAGAIGLAFVDRRRAEYGVFPQFLEAAGAIHNIGGLWAQEQVGHELTTALWVLEHSEEVGLVQGGSREQRRGFLRLMAHTLSQISPMHELLQADPSLQRTHEEALRRLIRGLEIASLTPLDDLLLPPQHPQGLHARILLVAKMSDGGPREVVTMEERLAALERKPVDPPLGHYYAAEAALLPLVRSRFLATRDVVETALGMTVAEAVEEYGH